MKVLNIGSLNLDYVYTLDHIVLPGEQKKRLPATFSLAARV